MLREGRWAGREGGCDVAFNQIQAATLSGNVSQAVEGITEALRKLRVSDARVCGLVCMGAGL